MQNNAAFWSGDSAWRLRFSVALVELLFFFHGVLLQLCCLLKCFWFRIRVWVFRE